MRLIFVFVLVAGLGLAGAAVWMAQGYISSSQDALAAARDAAAAQEAKPTVPVYVAARDIAYGEALAAADVVAIAWPADAVPETAFRDAAALFPGDGTRPRTVIRALAKFEPLLADKVTGPGEDAGLTSRLAKGMRAFAITVDVASGVSGFLRPGDRVDVYWSGTRGDAEITKLIETGVSLIAVDQSADFDPSNPNVIARTVTVEATPGQVAAFAQAQATGRLALSLVGTGDDTTAEAVEVDQNRLLGIERQAPVAVAEARVCTVRMRKGSEIIETPIPCTR